jgi:hypothetical protein
MQALRKLGHRINKYNGVTYDMSQDEDGGSTETQALRCGREGKKKTAKPEALRPVGP